MQHLAHGFAVISLAAACACASGCSSRHPAVVNEVPPTPASITGDPCAFKGLSSICVSAENHFDGRSILPEVEEAVRRAVPGVTGCTGNGSKVLVIEYQLVESTCADCDKRSTGAPIVFASFRVREGEHTVASAQWSALRPDASSLLQLFEVELSQLHQGIHWPNRCVGPGAS
jgi:hypothetical protein